MHTGFPCKSLVRHYSPWDKENFSARCSYLHTKYAGWAGQTPCGDRNQGPAGKPSNSKGLMTRGEKKNKKKTPKPQTASRHCTVSVLPTTSTTHAPTKLVLLPKLTYSAYPLPQSLKFSFLTEKKFHGKNPMEGTAKCIMIVSYTLEHRRIFWINAHKHTQKMHTQKNKENEPKILNFRKKLFLTAHTTYLWRHIATLRHPSPLEIRVLLSENFLQYKAFERQNPADIAGYPHQTEQIGNRSVVQTQQWLGTSYTKKQTLTRIHWPGSNMLI